MQSLEHWHAFLSEAEQYVLGERLAAGHIELVLSRYEATHSMPTKMSLPSDVPTELVGAVHSLRAMSSSHKIDLNNLWQEERNIKEEIFSILQARFSMLQARSSASQQTESVDVAQYRPLHVDMGGGAKKFLGMTNVPFEK